MQQTCMCPLCGSKELELALSITKLDRFELFEGIPSERYMRQWRICAECQVAVNCYDKNTSMIAEKLAKNYYEIDFRAGSLENKYRKIMDLDPEFSDNRHRVKRVASFVQEHSLLLTVEKYL